MSHRCSGFRPPKSAFRRCGRRHLRQNAAPTKGAIRVGSSTRIGNISPTRSYTRWPTARGSMGLSLSGRGSPRPFRGRCSVAERRERTIQVRFAVQRRHIAVIAAVGRCVGADPHTAVPVAATCLGLACSIGRLLAIRRALPARRARSACRGLPVGEAGCGRSLSSSPQESDAPLATKRRAAKRTLWRAREDDRYIGEIALTVALDEYREGPSDGQRARRRPTTPPDPDTLAQTRNIEAGTSQRARGGATLRA